MKKINKDSIKFIGIFLCSVLLIFVGLLTNNVSYSATTYTYYTKSEMQNIILSTAYSYLNNKYYSEYDQKSMDEAVLGSSGTSSSMNWRNFNVTPESVNRANYYHVDCSTFTSLVYIHSLGYDFNSYYKLSPAVYFKYSTEDSKFKSYDVSAYKDKLRFTNSYKYYGKGISTTFLQILVKIKILLKEKNTKIIVIQIQV